MARLMRVNNTLSHNPVQGAVHSVQVCTHSNTTLTCTMLAQNGTHPAFSQVHKHEFARGEAPVRGTSVRARHKHRALCSSCARANLTRVVTRLLKTVELRKGTLPQLSFGVPHRLSTERVVAAHLHRILCGANDTCSLLQRALPCADCLRRGRFMPALLANLSVQHSSLPATDALWDRNWVFCPHTQSNSPQDTAGRCAGSVPKSVWLDPRQRAGACAEQLVAHSPSSASINFCLLNKHTERLCLKMQSWIQKTEFFLCQAAGLCDDTDFFYSPTTFNLQEQEFVYDTVQRFYVEDVGLECAAASNNEMQAEANEAQLQLCASVSISPMLLIVQQLRSYKRSLVLLLYHYTRVCFRLLEVFVAVTADTAANVANDASNAVQVAAQALLAECTALMLLIGDFIERIGSSVLELAASRGVGSTFKEIVMALCAIVEWIYNNIWAQIMCPVVLFILEFLKYLLQVWEVVIDVLRSLYINVDVLVSFVEFVRNMIDVVATSLNECTPLPADVCVLGASAAANADARGVLPMPTRCWSTYVTFFGDNQQLSCTAADTCRLSSLSSEKIVCGACPEQTNPSVQQYACDYVTSICTCAVPQLRSSSCLVNEDCMLGDSETSCMLINDDLQLSRSAVSCTECKEQSMCFHSEAGDSGVCACGRRQRVFQLCTPEDAQTQNALSLMLNNLCLYSPANALFYELEFKQVSIIPCQLLDPTTASCVYVVDSNIYAVRGYNRFGRRLLSTEKGAYTSLDPACRDALESEALPHTRASCQAQFEMSRATLQMLSLDKQLPACALCSVADAVDATRSNPLAVLRILSSAHMLLTVARRHGPAERALHLFQTLLAGLTTTLQRIVASDASALVSIEHINGSAVVHVDDNTLPPPVARALESWVAEMLENNTCSGDTCRRPGRRLLFFRELVMAVEQRVRNGWAEADRLHEAFAEGVTQILTYRAMPLQQSAAAEQWGEPLPPASCSELRNLLMVITRITKGIRLGWLTLTHERDTLQGKPAATLSDAWPRLVHVDPADALPPAVLVDSDDGIVRWAGTAVNKTLDVLNVQPSFFYSVLFSVVSAANSSFTCSYEAVQTCSGWRVRLWQGIVVLVVYFSVAVVLLNAVGFTFISALLVPFFSAVLLQLCYGYQWTCVPMVPVCAWQDLHESLQRILPQTLEVPDELKNTSPECLVPCHNASELCLPRYPTALCTKSCKEAPFAYTSAGSVFAFALADMSTQATDFVLANSHHVPFLEHAALNRQLEQHIVMRSRASDELLSAHRICAVLSAYMLVPYFLLLLLVLGLLLSLLSLVSSQLFPLLLLFFSLFTAASVGPASTPYGDSDNAQQEQEADGDSPEVPQQDADDNAIASDTSMTTDHVVHMPSDQIHYFTAAQV